MVVVVVRGGSRSMNSSQEELKEAKNPEVFISGRSTAVSSAKATVCHADWPEEFWLV